MRPRARIGLSAAALAALCLAEVAAPRAAYAATVSVVPADTTVSPGDVFQLRVVVSAISDLKAFDVIHAYDPARLQFQGASAGDVFGGGPQALFVTPDAAPADSAWVDGARLIGSGAGPGILCFLTFKALSLGSSPIDCRLADLRDSQNVPAAPVCVPGVVRIAGPTPVLRTSWGGLKLHPR